MSFQFLPFYKNANILLPIKEERVFLLFVGSVHREEQTALVKDLGIKFQLEWTQRVSDICGTMCACEGWACSTEVYTSKCEVMTQDFLQKYFSASHTINGHRQYEFYLSNYWISALWSHLFLFLTVFETFNWNCREIWYEHLYFDLFGSCQALRINYQLARESKPESESSPDDNNRHKQETHKTKVSKFLIQFHEMVHAI